jgi:hypothetical protein
MFALNLQLSGPTMSQEFKAFADASAAEGKLLAKVGVILCGGNVDLDKLPWVVGL